MISGTGRDLKEKSAEELSDNREFGQNSRARISTLS
jgi:hypothetical protein